jgi:DNA invertase Pin-like site-specific DNA recombinase
VDLASDEVRRRRRAPAFEELMADARRRRFDCVLVWKYDGFARSLGALVARLCRLYEPSFRSSIDGMTRPAWIDNAT